MTDKELIKQEIEKRIEDHQSRLRKLANSEYFGRRWQENEELLKFIDSLPEEHNEDLDEEISNYIKDNFFGSKSMGFLSNRTKGELDSVDVANIARHFAEWQKDQMMKDAVECTWGTQATSSFMSDFPNIECGDKVKVIIVKED